MGELDGRVALLVGERLSTLSFGHALVEAGCAVIVADASAHEAGGSSLPLGPGWLGTVDASTPVACASVAAAARALGGHLDILVQHHPTLARVPAVDMDLAAWQSDIAQLTRTFTVARGFAQLAEVGAAIINLASIDLAQAYPTRATAAVVSNGLVGLTRALAVEWATIPIRVNLVALGVVLSQAERAMIARGEQFLDRVLLRAPGHRVGELSEAAALVRFLVGPGAQFITGQTVWADGGWSALTQHAEGLRFP